MYKPWEIYHCFNPEDYPRNAIVLTCSSVCHGGKDYVIYCYRFSPGITLTIGWDGFETNRLNNPDTKIKELNEPKFLRTISKARNIISERKLFDDTGWERHTFSVILTLWVSDNPRVLDLLDK